jgi:hypothetical protein
LFSLSLSISITTLINKITFFVLSILDVKAGDKSYTMAEFISTNRGGRKLIYMGYSFTHNRKFENGVVSWKCSKYKLFKCHARAVTKISNGIEYVKISKPHNHLEDFEYKKLRLSE